jgi:DNA-binding transcriptional MerR regulator
MTKEQLQQELKEKVKAGVKPSDIKRLKRSKSANDVNPNPPTPLLQDQLQEKQKEIEELRAQLENQPALSEFSELIDNSLQARHQSLKD